MLVAAVLRRLRQGNSKLKAILEYIVRVHYSHQSCNSDVLFLGRLNQLMVHA